MTTEPKTVEEMAESVYRGKLSRRAFIGGLTGFGVTAAGATTILAGVTHRLAPPHAQQSPVQQHLDLHNQHVVMQTQGNVNAMMNDYADHAIVDDPLFTKPFIGKDAIAKRYAAEVASVPDRHLTITNRTMVGNQLVVEWEATGTHQASFLGFGGTGQSFRLTGTTVVTRENGKIIRESHHFDVADLRRQLAV